MNREQRQPQILDVKGVPEQLAPIQVMHLMEQTLWAPSTTSLTEIEFQQIGMGCVVAGTEAANQCDTE